VTMKVRIDKELCTGCGTCVEICPEVFELQDDLALNKLGGNKDIPEELQHACENAADSCPVAAITIE